MRRATIAALLFAALGCGRIHYTGENGRMDAARRDAAAFDAGGRDGADDAGSIDAGEDGGVSSDAAMPSGMTPSYGSPYERDVVLPECDDADPEVHFIRSDADWARVNDPALRIFCVVPGDYQGVGTITLSASSTARNRRWLLLDPNVVNIDLHPANIPEAQHAIVGEVVITGTDWTLDRIHSRLDCSSRKTPTGVSSTAISSQKAGGAS